VVGPQHLVIRPEIQRPGDDTRAHGRIPHEDDVLRSRSDVRRKALVGLRQQAGQASLDEIYRLALQLALPVLIGLEHGARTCPKATVIQEGDAGLKEELVAGVG
jgi:hypothetical protein